MPGIGNSQAFDSYAFVYNSPIYFIDPTGHWGQCLSYMDCDGSYSNAGSVFGGGYYPPTSASGNDEPYPRIDDKKDPDTYGQLHILI